MDTSGHSSDSLDAEIKTKSASVVFVPNGNVKLTHHPGGDGRSSQSNFAPDLVGVPGPLESYRRPVKDNKLTQKSSKSPIYGAIPYPLVRTAVEMKPPREDGRAQAISYAWYIFEACPHVVGMYVLSTRPQYYQVIWADAAGAVSSPRYGWENLIPLVSYVYSLYSPPKGHYLLDSTIEPRVSPGGDLIKALLHKVGPEKPQLKWNVTVNSRVYEDCRLIVWSGGFGRRTTVFQTEPKNATEPCLVIKDMYRDEARRFSEKQIIDLIHSDGIVPGVVRLVAHEEVKSSVHGGEATPIRTVGTVMHQGKLAHRVRTRLLLGSSGEPLSRAKSLGDLLKAIYDTVESESLITTIMASNHHSSSSCPGHGADDSSSRYQC